MNETICDEFHIFHIFGWLQRVEGFYSPCAGQSHIVERVHITFMYASKTLYLLDWKIESSNNSIYQETDIQYATASSSIAISHKVQWLPTSALKSKHVLQKYYNRGEERSKERFVQSERKETQNLLS